MGKEIIIYQVILGLLDSTHFLLQSLHCTGSQQIFCKALKSLDKTRKQGRVVTRIEEERKRNYELYSSNK
jgi:hypothetical protein